MKGTMNSKLIYHPEVQTALENKTPVVALESTVISHGLPYPVNLSTAHALEVEVRTAGAIPATTGRALRTSRAGSRFDRPERAA